MSLNTQYLCLKIFITIASLFTTGYTASACNFTVKLEQFLHNDGYHRNLSYHVTFGGTVKDNRWMHRDCILALDQTLPSGIFANPDELADLKRLKKLNAIPKNKINVEMLAELSEPSGVYIINKVTKDRVDVSLPVHARYHMAVAGGGSFRNEIFPPQLYLRCPDKRLDLCDEDVLPAVKFLCNGNSMDKCSWKEIPFDMMTNTLLWYVPVGNTDHYYLVALGNAMIGVVGSLYLLKTILEYKVAARRRRF